jgi:hypothetical protein
MVHVFAKKKKNNSTTTTAVSVHADRGHRYNFYFSLNIYNPIMVHHVGEIGGFVDNAHVSSLARRTTAYIPTRIGNGHSLPGGASHGAQSEMRLESA